MKAQKTLKLSKHYREYPEAWKRCTSEIQELKKNVISLFYPGIISPWNSFNFFHLFTTRTILRQSWILPLLAICPRTHLMVIPVLQVSKLHEAFCCIIEWIPQTFQARLWTNPLCIISEPHKGLYRWYSAKYILEGDIQSCFDMISHVWILNNIPMKKPVLMHS